MKTTGFFILTSFLAAIFFAGIAMAGEGKLKMSSAEPGMTNLHSAEKFIGTEVRDARGADIGEVKDVVFNFDRGIGYAVVSTDEFGKTDNTFLVPLSAFTTTHEGEYVTLTVSRDQLAAAPQRDVNMSDEAYDRMLYDFYGVSYPWDEYREELLEEMQLKAPGSNLTNPGALPYHPDPAYPTLPSGTESVRPAPDTRR